LALLADTFGRIDSVVLLDALSVPIGIGLPGGKFKTIIPQNSAIPFEKTYQFTTTKEGQTSLDIDIFQGESATVVENEYLGSFVVDSIPKAGVGESKIHLTFHLDSECILHLRAKESLSGRTHEARMVIRETPDCIKEQFEKEEEI
jgi:molecular chaperone DnaK